MTDLYDVGGQSQPRMQIKHPSLIAWWIIFFVGLAVPSIAASPPLPPLNEAQQLIEEGRLDQAHTLLESLLARDPSATEARLELARLFNKMGDLGAAIHEYEQLTSTDPQNRDLQKEFAWTLMRASYFDQAVAIYDRLLEEEPSAIDLHLRKAMALYGTGDHRGAIREYKTVLDIDPSNLEAEVAIKELQELGPRPFHLMVGTLISIVLIIVLISLVVVVFMSRRSRPSQPPSFQPDTSRREEHFIHFVAMIGVVVATYYIFWRLTSTMNWEAWWFSIPLFGAELYGVIAAYMFFFMVWHPTHRAPPPPMTGRTVDVFITTYDEDPNLLRKTILGCLAITYPHKTYVLDDGNRPEVARLAQESGCEYIAREKNINAKAGNLNNALRLTSGEFIVTLDADHVPLPHFVDRLLGYFRDEKVAFVQTPQDFYNVDSFQHRVDKKHRRMWTEQSLFYSVIQPGKDHWNSAFYCGTCAILRRSALEEIGGFAEATVTEDLHTSILLHAKGYKSVYQNESLAYGLAPATALPFHLQRLRWGQGAMQVLVRDNPLWTKGLTLSQRISYLASMTTYFDGFQKQIYYLAPVVYFLTGILPIKTFDVVFLSHFIPYFILFLLSFELMSRGFGSTLTTEQYNMAKFATSMKSTLGLISKKRVGFAVTPKMGQERTGFTLLHSQLFVLVLNISGIGIGTFRYFWKADLEPLAYFGNLLWALFNTGLASTIIRFSRRKIQLRSSYRFPYLLPCSLYPVNSNPRSTRIGLVRDCHEEGASLITLQSIPEGTALHLSMTVGKRVVPVEGIVISSIREGKEGPPLFRQSVRFTNITQEDQHYLIKYSFEFSIPKFMWSYNRRNTVFEQLESCLRHEQRLQKRWTVYMPITIRFRSDGRTHEILATTDDLSEGGLSVMCTEELALSEPVDFIIDLADQRIQGTGRTIRRENIYFGGFQIYRHVIQFQQVGAGDVQPLQQLSWLLRSAQAR